MTHEYPQESDEARLARIQTAVDSYKNSVEFLPILGGKIVIPDDIVFLLSELKFYKSMLENN